MIELIPVKAEQDNDGHWYVIPNKISDEFNKDLEDMDDDDFDDKYGKCRTGGDLNLIQLYAYI